MSERSLTLNASKNRRSKNGNPGALTSTTSENRPPSLSADAEENTIKLYLEQAEICCEQAREATRCRRFEAARGLFATAVALCSRALAASGADGSSNSNQHLQQHVERISSEMAAHSLLASSMQRPLRVSSAQSSTRLSPSKPRRAHL